MAIVYTKSEGLTDRELHYCPGCHHGIVHKLVAENLVEMGLVDTAIGVAPVGCSGFMPYYMNNDFIGAAHGRAAAVATAVKRTHPDQLVFSYQGDGDAVAIGCSEVVHSALRGEKITTIMINNAIYGMTGGQMSPCTLVGQKATTAPLGRNAELAGKPIRMAEMLSTIDGLVYAERVAVYDIPHLNKAKAAIKKAFEIQQKGLGYTFVEVLSICPTNWGMTPIQAEEWLKANMEPYYPLGVIKDTTGEAK